MRHSTSTIVAALAAVFLYALPAVAADSYTATDNTTADMIADAELLTADPLTSNSLSNCEGSCSSTSGCTMAAYLPDSSECWLFGPGSNTYQVKEQWTSAVRSAAVADSAAAPQFSTAHTPRQRRRERANKKQRI